MIVNTKGAIALTAALITLTAMVITTVTISSVRISRLSNSTDFTNAVKAYNDALALRDEILADGDIDNFYTPDTSAHCNASGGNPIWELHNNYLYCIDDASRIFELHVRANSGAIIQKVALQVQSETFENPLNCAVVPMYLPPGTTFVSESDEKQQNEEGISVGISGNRVISGIPSSGVTAKDVQENPGLRIIAGSGSINIYEYTGGNDWELWSLPLDSPHREHQTHIGDSVAIHGDYAVAGAPRQRWKHPVNEGKIIVFERQDVADWGNETVVTAPTYTGQFDKFGFDMDLDCFVLAVSAPGRALFVGTDPTDDNHWYYFTGTVFMYEKLAGVNEWVVRAQLQPPIPDSNNLQFGSAISLHEDKIIVGAIGDLDKPGKAYVYTRNSPTDWGEGVELINPNPTNGDSFGGGVAIVGSHAVVGAPLLSTSEGFETGIAYYYEEVSPGNWVHQETFLPSELGELNVDEFGFDIAMDGNDIFIGAPKWDPGGHNRKGGVFHYKIGGPNWPDYENIFGNDTGRSMWMGRGVDTDGTNVVAGAPRSTTFENGELHLFEIP